MSQPGEAPVPEASLEQMSFSELIVHRIGQIAVPEHVRDPYERPRISTPVRHSGTTHHRDGRLEFGADYDTRRVWVGQEFELIYTHLKRLDRADLYVHQFAPKGGLRDRTHFSQHGDRPHIYKSWQGRSFGGILDNDQLSFGRELKPREETVVRQIVLNPLANVDLVKQIVQISPKEQKQIDANEKRQLERAKQLREDLEAISQAQRRAQQNAHNIIIG